jgi:hypothetical protein
LERTVKEVFLNCKSWQDFVSELAPLTKKQKGDYFEILPKIFPSASATPRKLLFKFLALITYPSMDSKMFSTNNPSCKR